MTVAFRDITGKEEETVPREELERQKKASDLIKDYLGYFNKNKIYFDRESSELIEEIGEVFRESHSTITFLKQMKFKPSRPTYERTEEARNKVREVAQPLIERLKNKLRGILEE